MRGAAAEVVVATAVVTANVVALPSTDDASERVLWKGFDSGGWAGWAGFCSGGVGGVSLLSVRAGGGSGRESDRCIVGEGFIRGSGGVGWDVTMSEWLRVKGRWGDEGLSGDFEGRFSAVVVVVCGL